MKTVTRRIRVGVVAFESLNIQRMDRALVAMTGDVRVGELGYFETGHYVGGAPGAPPRHLVSHRWFAFLCDQDALCREWIERSNGICLRRSLDRCEGEHGAEPFEESPTWRTDTRSPGGVLVETYGRVVAVERDGVPIDTSLALRGLDEREQATTAIVSRGAFDGRPVVHVVRPDALPSIECRMQPLTSGQHKEIARLIRSSMDSARNPTPALSKHGRMVVRREVTTLANVACVRRSPGHASTFRRALAAFERQCAADSLSLADRRAGRLAIEHLWRWLHGYVRSIEPEPLGAPDLRDGDNFEVVSGMMMIELPCDMPSEDLHAGDMIMIKKGVPIPSGELGVIRIDGGMAMGIGRVFQLDPHHLRLGSDPGEVYPVADVEIVGPVISGGAKFIPLDKAETDAAVRMFESAFPGALSPDSGVLEGGDEWPDVIGEAS